VTLRIESLPRERTGEIAPIWAITMGFELPAEAIERFARLPEYDVRLAAVDDGGLLGAAGSFTFELTTPGGFVEAAGLTGVGVYPMHRRRGLLRQLMRRYLDEVHERGQPVSALWASEAAIYRRFGYGVASLQGSLELSVERAALVPGADVEGRVRLLDEDEALTVCPPIYDALRRETPGMLARSDEWWRVRRLDDPEWSRRGRSTLRRAVLDVDGEPAAYALYRQSFQWQDGIPGGGVHVNEAIGSTPASTRAIWRYLCQIDLMDTVTGWMLPVDHPLLLLAVELRRLGFRLGDGLWIRLVDVGAALGARAYGAADPVVVDVRDSFCAWNEGRWRIGDGGAERVGRKADLALDVSALGSAYLGGFAFAQLARAGIIEELTAGAAARADALFVRDRAPWCPEIF
jgi:predicted acetyltransferase